MKSFAKCHSAYPLLSFSPPSFFIYPPQVHIHTHTHCSVSLWFPQGQWESHSTAQATPQSVSIRGIAFALEKVTYFA